MQEVDSEIIYLTKLWESLYTKKRSIVSGLFNKPESAYLKDIKVFLGYSENTLFLDNFFKKMINLKIFSEVDKVVANGNSKRVYSKYIIDGNKLIKYIKENDRYKEAVKIHLNSLWYGT